MNSKNLFYLKDLKTINNPKLDLILIQNSIYFVKSKILVINDIHLGFESTLSKEGIFVPNTNLNLITKKINQISKTIKTNNFDIDKLIINGDLKHSFTELDKHTKYELDSFFEALNKQLNPKEIIVIKGNHDTFLNLYFIKKEIKFLESYEFKEDKIQVIVLHGHKNIELNENCLYIIGHDHPAIGIKKGTTYEQYKCFLIGKTSKSYIILPPSFTDVSVGTNVLKGVFLSPILNKLQKTDEHFINKWDVIINESNEFYHFKINDLINI